MYVQQMYAYYPGFQNRELDPLEVELQIVVSCHMNAENWTNCWVNSTGQVTPLFVYIVLLFEIGIPV